MSAPTPVPDARGYSIVDAAISLILHAPAYAEKTVEAVVEELWDLILATPHVLDHPADCQGCDVCQNPESEPESVH